MSVRIIPDDTRVDFMKRRYLAFALSALMIAASIGMLFTKGLSLGIDFTGGTLIEAKTPDLPDLGELRGLLNTLDLGEVSIQEFGAPEDILIRLPQQDGGPDAQQAAINKVYETLNARYADTEPGIDYRRTEFVGPQVGEELKKQGMMAFLFSLLGILIYIWFRFEWQFGLAAIIALAHDAIATLGFFSLMQIEFNLSTVAAVLMIAGYSINDTVVVFDRIRENLRKYKKTPLNELFNMSINQTLSRTLLTSITTLLALLALWFFGGEVIQSFVDALLFGIVVGTYSSIFVAAPVLILLNIRRGAFADEEKNAEDATN